MMDILGIKIVRVYAGDEYPATIKLWVVPVEKVQLSWSGTGEWFLNLRMTQRHAMMIIKFLSHILEGFPHH